jgi:hypothetical protein
VVETEAKAIAKAQKLYVKDRATNTLRNAAHDWADGRITTAKRDTVRASAKQAIKQAKRPERIWDRPKRGLV